MTPEQRIKSRKAVVGVIGLGYVGLPLIRLFASKGFRTLGFDIDESKVEKLRKGESYIKSVDAATLKKIRARFEATSDFSRLAAADVVVSWEALDLMHNDQGLPIEQVEAAMRGGLARLLGPGLGGALVELLTAPLAVALDALAYVVDAALVWAIRTPEPAPRRQRSYRMVWLAGALVLAENALQAG